ncbi:glycoside hydrolase domain-containing protein [Anaerosacchariphilus polymeriproducens]|uniref:DUF1906 domain-containing protein n=1 Tax=Anaerosacchariphilus polymeriproducens TaxID=1812858 RepID=A0A371ARK2_9FIRM|nr:glycoside hydrolase domain-containing protein [Anaerosacchariphilus polymeriproducens]RDU22195.1 DUF1906 domain-containing protein [Anaerosacchariphilus polymeriproducens]
MDQMVLETQKWLNLTYGRDPRFEKVTESGHTGWNTINGLIIALQIELGIQQTAASFGNGTKAKFNEKYPNGIKQQNNSDKSTSNVYSIIQGSLWCKGYSTGNHITQNFYSETGRAIKELKSDMGIGGDSTVTLDVMKALLSMQQFVLLKAYGGTEVVRNIQKTINQNYKNYTGIIPCDGLYGREMNKALIQILQSLEGYSPNEATGNFGNGTRSKLKKVTSGNANSYGTWVWLAKAVLNCIKYSCVQSNTWDDGFETQLSKFQNEYKIPVTKELDTNTWMALLTSKGNPDRDAKACDTRFEITISLLNKLKADGFEIVGRYLTGGSFKEIRDGELERIVTGGLKYFPIFQENGRELSEFTYSKGLEHGKKACKAALGKGVPSTIIYFAVDMDIYDYQIDSNIIPYFKGINEAIDSRYSVGIYASRNVCTRVSNVGYAVSSFVSDMSTGFSGNLGFPIPTNWNYDQFHEISGYGGNWDLDKVAYSGRISACSTVTEKSEYQDEETLFLNWVKKTEKECLKNFEGILNPYIGYKYVVGRAILEYLRKPEYWSENYNGLWTKYTPEVGLISDETTARALCQTTCDKQSNIKGQINNLDIAHMSATALGYIHWGISDDKGGYSLGDLGGWPLDLLQIWGAYSKEGNNEDLEKWLRKYLGNATDGKGFGYDDILADADAYLLVAHMQNKNSENSFSETITELYQISKNNRIKMFYKERFNLSKENVKNAFKKLADGIDIWVFENFDYGKKKLLSASGADNLPTKSEAETLALVYASFLENPIC